MLALHQATKNYGAFTALDSFDFTVRPGEIVALLGENGAGKSTTIGLIGGELHPDDGRILWQGEAARWKNPREAASAGIGVVHQHFKLVPAFTVAENFALHDPRGGRLYRARDWEDRARQWADGLGWKIDPGKRIDQLSVGEAQRVEIIKALFAGHSDAEPTRLLLLDEPTANLTPGETAELFQVLRRLKSEGLGIVFVSHKLREVMDLCDRVVVLRHGRNVGERLIAETDAADLAALMVGSAMEPAAPRQKATHSERTLKISGLTYAKVRDFSLEVRGGEIVGLAGVDGNGQGELMDIFCGLRDPEAGTWGVENGPADTPIALIPADRQQEGLILDFDITQNLALHPGLRRECRSRRGFAWPIARARAREAMARFDVRAPATRERTRVRQLSGGNQQKVVIARALAFGASAVIASDPTRGLDVGATRFVHEQLRAAAAQGQPVLLLSTDLEEIMSLCDRVGVLYEGRLLPGPELLAADVGREKIGRLMGGGG